MRIIFISIFSFALVIIQIVSVYGQVDFSYNKNIDKVIGELINKCSNLHNDACIAVMATLNEICKVKYFPNCFGEQWTPFMQYLEKLIEKGLIQRDDPYLTLNNEHYGNDSIQFNK